MIPLCERRIGQRNLAQIVDAGWCERCIRDRPREIRNAGRARQEERRDRAVIVRGTGGVGDEFARSCRMRHDAGAIRPPCRAFRDQLEEGGCVVRRDAGVRHCGEIRRVPRAPLLAGDLSRQRALAFLLRGEVFEGSQRADDLATAPPRRDREQERQAVARSVVPLDLDRADRGALHHPRAEDIGPLLLLRRHDGRSRAERLAGGVAEKRLRSAVPGGNRAGCVGADDRIGQGIEILAIERPEESSSPRVLRDASRAGSDPHGQPLMRGRIAVVMRRQAIKRRGRFSPYVSHYRCHSSSPVPAITCFADDQSEKEETSTPCVRSSR